MLTPFALYAVVAVVLFSVLGKGFDAGLLVGVAAGGVIYALIATVMVKFGWNPPMFQSKEERAAAATASAERRAARAAGQAGADAPHQRHQPQGQDDPPLTPRPTPSM